MGRTVISLGTRWEATSLVDSARMHEIMPPPNYRAITVPVNVRGDTTLDANCP
jgi:hypothetical protein